MVGASIQKPLRHPLRGTHHRRRSFEKDARLANVRDDVSKGLAVVPHLFNVQLVVDGCSQNLARTRHWAVERDFG